MNISASLFDDMVSIPPEGLKILRTQSERDRYGLTTYDPVFEEEMAAIIMKKYGITRIEYNERKATWGLICGRHIQEVGAQMVECMNRVMATGQ